MKGVPEKRTRSPIPLDTALIRDEMRAQVACVHSWGFAPGLQRNLTPMLALATRLLREPVSHRLAEEFLTVPVDTIDRCVADVCACAQHLGITATPEIVERVAREHLLAIVNSAPPPRSHR